MPHLLVVDDSKFERQIARGLLEKVDGWTVSTATDGVDALEQVDEHLPDLVLTDLQMPNMDGLELVETIRNEYPLIPVVLMTAEGSEVLAVKALQRGAASYVSKSDLAVDLVDTLQRVLERAAHGRNRRRLLNFLTELQYVLDNDLELLAIMVGEVRDLVKERCLFDENDSLRLATAIDEALLLSLRQNLGLPLSTTFSQEDRDLIQSGRQQGLWQDRRLHAQIQIRRTEVQITITHCGLPFDLRQLEHQVGESAMSDMGTRGLQLMHALCDEIHFAPSGQSVTLMKKTRWSEDTLLTENEAGGATQFG